MAVLAAIAWPAFLPAPAAHDIADAQAGQQPGRSIGRISTHQDLIVFELNEGALGHANMFDLEKRTVRFTPAAAGGYLVETRPLQWDAEEGVEMTGPQMSLRNFTFPFSGKNWDTLTIGVTGSIAFAPPAGGQGGRAGSAGGGQPGAGGRGGGVTIGRFDQLQEAAPLLVNAQPSICVFMKPRMSGTRAVNELSDRIVITWSLTSRLPASRTSPGCRPSIDFKPCCTRPAPLEGNPGLSGITYQVTLRSQTPATPAAAGDSGDIVWTVRGASAGGRGGRGGAGGTPRYTASGDGVSSGVTVNGNTVSLQGVLPKGFKPRNKFLISGRASGPASAADEIAPQPVTVAGLPSPHQDLSSTTTITCRRRAGPISIFISWG